MPNFGGGTTLEAWQSPLRCSVWTCIGTAGKGLVTALTGKISRPESPASASAPIRPSFLVSIAAVPILVCRQRRQEASWPLSPALASP